jgi:hypothetical protein
VRESTSTGSEGLSINYYGNPGLTAVTMLGSFLSTQPDGGGEWTATPLNNMQVRLYMASVADVPVCWAFHVDLWLATKPVTTATPNPFSGGIAALAPLVNLTQAADGDAPWHMRVKVFTKAVAEAGGFDANTAANVYDSGWINWSSTHQVSPSTPLNANADYYVYAVSSTLAGGGVGEYIGDWSGTAFKTASRPVINITAPAVTNARPPIAWTYTDAHFKAQDTMELRIYERPGANWTGFDPDTTTATPVWSVVGVPATSPITPTVSLNNSTSHRVYGKVTSIGPFVMRSNWDFEEWTTAYTAPATPTLTAVQDQTNARHTITLRNNQNTAGAVVTLERSLDGGTTWEIVRNYTSVSTTQDGVGWYRKDIGYNTTTTLYDYEVPFNQQVKYRAYTETDNVGVYVKSAFTTVVNATLDIDRVWVGVVTDPGVALHFLTQDVWITKSKRKPRGLYEPLGRSKPIVFRGSANQESFSMQFLAMSEAEFLTMDGILDDPGTLYVRTSRRMYYVEHSADMTMLNGLWDDLHSRARKTIFQCQFVEVGRPPI